MSANPANSQVRGGNVRPPQGLTRPALEFDDEQAGAPAPLAGAPASAFSDARPARAPGGRRTTTTTSHTAWSSVRGTVDCDRPVSCASSWTEWPAAWCSAFVSHQPSTPQLGRSSPAGALVDVCLGSPLVVGDPLVEHGYLDALQAGTKGQQRRRIAAASGSPTPPTTWRVTASLPQGWLAAGLLTPVG